MRKKKTEIRKGKERNLNDIQKGEKLGFGICNLWPSCHHQRKKFKINKKKRLGIQIPCWWSRSKNQGLKGIRTKIQRMKYEIGKKIRAGFWIPRWWPTSLESRLGNLRSKNKFRFPLKKFQSLRSQKRIQKPKEKITRRRRAEGLRQSVGVWSGIYRLEFQVGVGFLVGDEVWNYQ